MAGGGDSVAGVILLSFPQTGTGCGFKALISMLQQAGGKRRVIPHVSILYWFMMLFAFDRFYRVKRRQRQGREQSFRAG